MRTASRLGSLALALLLLLSAAPALAAKPTATPDPNPKPTRPKDVTPYSTEHPEELLPEQLWAWSAILIEAKTGEVIFEKNPDDIRYPASTTKILTGLLAILLTPEEEMDRTVVASEQAVAVNYQEEDVTSLKLEAGEEISFRDLLCATLIYSANDGANVLAEASAGSIERFVELMNEAAAAYGCTNTHFANAHGLHDDAHYTTPRDLALITRAAMQNDTFRDIVAMQSITIPKTNVHRARTFNTTNDLFRAGTEEKPNRYYYPDIIGVKTGFTGKAQYCFVGAAERDGVELISVVMYSGNDSRWADTIKLMDYGFSQYGSVTPIELYNMNPVSVTVSGYSLKDSEMGRLPLACTATDGASRSARIVARHEEIDSMARNLRNTVLIQYTRDFTAPVTAGETMGTMTYLMEDGTSVVYNLTATRSIAKREDAPPTLDEIRAATEADPNPFPPMSPEIALLVALPFAITVGLILLIRRLIVGRRKRPPKGPKITQRYLR